MNKTELIAAMSEVSGLTKKDCEAALAAFTGAVETAMKGEDKVQLVGFGSFEVKERPARVGRNPRTGESMTPPARCRFSSPARPSKTPSSNHNTTEQKRPPCAVSLRPAQGGRFFFTSAPGMGNN